MRRTTRRAAIIAAGILATIGAPAATARAADFPAKDIAFIIPDGPGGGFDAYVRAIAPAMEKYLPNKVNIVPTNVPGAGGARAATELARAKPDGYTICLFNVPGIYIQQQEGAGFDLTKFTWLGRVGVDAYGLAVAANSPLKSMADLKTLSQSRPIKFTSTGPAGTAYNATLVAAHLLGLSAQLITGYKGSSDYVVGAIRGDGDAVVTVIPTLRRMGAGDTLRILADFEAKGSVAGAEDATALGQPELAQITLERLVAGPPKLPPEIKAALATALTKAIADPQTVAWAKQTDAALDPATPEEAAGILQEQIKFYDTWKPVLKGK